MIIIIITISLIELLTLALIPNTNSNTITNAHLV